MMVQLLCIAVVLGLLLHCVVESFSLSSHKPTGSCNISQECSDVRFECVHNFCKCKADNNDVSCSPCPDLGGSCSISCCTDSLICNDGVCRCRYSDCRGTGQNDEFILAAQIALGSALLIALAALCSLIWKTYSRRRQLQRARARRAAREQRESDTGSMGSEQLYVVQRLRDRPPCYEEITTDDTEKPPSYQESIAPQTGGYNQATRILRESSPPYTFQAPQLPQYSTGSAITTLPAYEPFDADVTALSADSIIPEPQPLPSAHAEDTTSTQCTTVLSVDEFLSQPRSTRHLIGEVVNSSFQLSETDRPVECQRSDLPAATVQPQNVSNISTEDAKQRQHAEILRVKEILSTPQSRRRIIEGRVNPAFQQDSMEESELHM